MAEFRLTGSRLIVRGDLDQDSQVELRDYCRDLLAGGSDPVTVDLSKVGDLTSMCIGTLIALWIDLRESGRRGKIVPSPSVMRLLEVTGLADVLLRPPAVKEAVRGDGGADGGEQDKESKHEGAKRAEF